MSGYKGDASTGACVCCVCVRVCVCTTCVCVLDLVYRVSTGACPHTASKNLSFTHLAGKPIERRAAAARAAAAALEVYTKPTHALVAAGGAG
jgi:hypothetical protein